MARLEFDWCGGERTVEFTFTDGKEYSLPLFSTLSVSEIAEYSDAGADATQAQRAEALMDRLLADAGLPPVRELPQDFVTRLAKAMGGGSLGE